MELHMTFTRSQTIAIEVRWVYSVLRMAGLGLSPVGIGPEHDHGPRQMDG
jgi:hypothetical protein